MFSYKKAILICVVQETKEYLPACGATTKENATIIFSPLLQYISRHSNQLIFACFARNLED